MKSSALISQLTNAIQDNVHDLFADSVVTPGEEERRGMTEGRKGNKEGGGKGESKEGGEGGRKEGGKKRKGRRKG